MKKIGFVIPWYGDNIPGGAEKELYGLVKHLHISGMELEVLTTCVKQFSSDWSVNFHPSGCTIEDGISVRRFPVCERDAAAFDAVNDKLMHGMHITEKEEIIYTREMINSPDLYTWLKKKADDYSLFVFIPYMFATTYHGLSINPEKSILIPCLHDESYIHMRVFKRLFPTIRGMIFHSDSEMRLAECTYNLGSVDTVMLGEGVDTTIQSNGTAFCEKYRINKPFILYAGRKEPGKNVDLLLEYFFVYKQCNHGKLLLILIGGGETSIPAAIENDVIDLGFVPLQDKYNAYGAATLLCQPSTKESFSLVIMESWVCGKPVLVHTDCPVTKYFVHASNGGLYFNTYREFEGCVNYILNNRETALTMGEQGRNFVRSHFSWDTIVEKYTRYFRKLCN
jgi:glycosyltransferase involved in cell wall biosynthesis